MDPSPYLALKGFKKKGSESTSEKCWRNVAEGAARLEQKKSKKTARNTHPPDVTVAPPHQIKKTRSVQWTPFNVDTHTQRIFPK